jgi:hypothetical protein
MQQCFHRMLAIEQPAADRQTSGLRENLTLASLSKYSIKKGAKPSDFRPTAQRRSL